MAWFIPTNPWPALLRGHTHTDMHTHTHRYAHVAKWGAYQKKKNNKKLDAQHKTSCWSNYRKMAEHNEAGPSIRKEIE